jgi:hypothetical protein
MTQLIPAKRRRTIRRAATRTQIYRWMRTPHFPILFFIRNLAYLEREKWFAQKSPASKGVWAARLFLERVQCFRAVRRLIAARRGETAWEKPETRTACDLPHPEVDYCDHCGGCCEIASGLAEFPMESQLPKPWRECFDRGLGPGHRFCAFMWEAEQSGKSLCAIHPWRANPCRVFEADDCEIFKQDMDFIVFSKSGRLKVLRRLLPRILRR